MTPGANDPAEAVSITSDEELDDALEHTFPASDPPAQTQAIVHVGVKTTDGGRPPRAHR